ncbi:MAG: hypothetical protein NZ585_14115 [Chloracidobacterium sp.]|nr:hypothetical protein [Chloracidobacterium sp.]MDW8216871.1 hypothetical protein [Acidobacteriota bacterium]
MTQKPLTPIHDWTEAHARHLAEAFKKMMRKAKPGKVYFLRNPSPDVLYRLPNDDLFCEALEGEGWQVFRVADQYDLRARAITSDHAVAIRETKQQAVLFLVDTQKAGPGMDGIYSAGTELSEKELIDRACKHAFEAIPETFHPSLKRVLALAKKRDSQRPGWFQFDFLARVVGHPEQWPEYLWLLGLWPCAASRLQNIKRKADEENLLKEAATMADALLGVGGERLTPEARMAQVGVRAPSPEGLDALRAFLEEQRGQSTDEALRRLRDRPDLWLGPLHLEPPDDRLDRIELVGWRSVRGAQPLKWSGLHLDPADQTLLWVVDPDADDAPPLTVKWRVLPETLKPQSVQYRVAVVSDLDETLAEREVTHTGKAEEKTAFTADDLALNGSVWVRAKVVVEAEGQRAESESFVIRSGRVEVAAVQRAVGRRVRTLSEGLIELDEPAAVAEALKNDLTEEGMTGWATLIVSRNRRLSISAPALLREVARLWSNHHGKKIGRWRLMIRASGRWARDIEFVPYSPIVGTPMRAWHRVCSASGRLAEYVRRVGLYGLCYAEGAPSTQIIGEYLDAWGELLEAVAAQKAFNGPPLPLVGTIEVYTSNNQTVGLIVSPLHPLRLAWLTAYDALLFHARWTEGAPAEAIRREFHVLDGAWFPAWLPGVDNTPAFVFAETLSLHAVAMTRANATEPKADCLLLARALENQERPDDAVPPETVDRRIIERLGAEIKAYADGHPYQRRLHVHALRAGDGRTITRALGWAQAAQEASPASETDDAEPSPDKAALTFMLELYAPPGGTRIDGGFLDHITIRRRARGRAAIPAEDRWITEVRPGVGGHLQPTFQWAQRPVALPETPAHLGVLFDAFASAVATAVRPPLKGDAQPFYGLLSGLIRTYRASPTPTWEAFLPNDEKTAVHPAGEVHTERLRRLQRGIAAWLTLGRPGASPILRAALSPESKAELDRLHALCDWVVTFDRFAGAEYLDHPRAHPDAYETYVIDYLPERDDLGDARIVVSTALMTEVVELLGELLKQVGLPEDAAAAQFLLERLKALSRRLPIRLAGARPPAQELLALAYASASCAAAEADDPCWVSLRQGVLVPLDDVRDLLPASNRSQTNRGPERRADFLYVSLASDARLQMRVIEVKYRRHLADFSAEEKAKLLTDIRAQVEVTRERFRAHYLDRSLPKSFRALHQARLLRVIKSYADKSVRHHLEAAAYDALCAELDRAFAAAGDYEFDTPEGGDRGWVFCPAFDKVRPLELSHAGWPVPTFCFGPHGTTFTGRPLHSPAQPLHHEVRQAATTDLPALNRHAAGGFTGDGDPALVREPASNATGGDYEEVMIPLGWTPDGAPVNWRLTIQGNPHLLVVGLPGMGKTTCLVNIARRMYAQGICPIVFSYAPDFDEKMAVGGRVDFIEVGRLDFNPLEINDHATPRAYVQVAGMVRDIFAAIYPDLGELQLNALRKAIVESFRAAGWDDTTTGGIPPFRSFVDLLRRTPRPDAGLRNLLARLDELEDYGFFDAPLGQEPQSLWTRERPVIVPLHRQPVETLQTGLATLVLYKLYKDMFRRGPAARITHAVIFDEAHRARRLTLIPTMAKECRKFGVSLVLASQEARDFDRSLFSAIGRQLVLRVNEADARALTQNVAASSRQRTLADELKALPKFHALYFDEGGQVVLCRLFDEAEAERRR